MSIKAKKVPNNIIFMTYNSYFRSKYWLKYFFKTTCVTIKWIQRK
jgi:hypothetical protein